MTEDITKEYRLPVSRACRMTGLTRSQYYYSSRKDDTEVAEALQGLAFKHFSYGSGKLFSCLRRDGKSWNHKKVYRVYKLLKLNKKRKGKRRLPARVKQPLLQPACINKTWSMDFMSDTLACGRKFRTFNVMDDGSREALAIETDTSLSSKRVTRVLDRIIEERGAPQSIRADNGPEFTSKELGSWAEQKGIEIQFTQPGKPTQNGFIERFNRIYREAILDAYLFFHLYEVRVLTAEWIEEYNYRRPHESLKNITPGEWKIMLSKKETTPIKTV